jgi:hypothetical protein
VYQCGSSDRNLLTIDRAIELTALAHRKHLRYHGDTALERVVLSRWDAITTDIDHLLSVPNIRSMAEGLRDWLRDVKAPKFMRKQLDEWADKTDDALDTVETIDKMVDLYQPFVHDNHYIFVSQALFQRRDRRGRVPLRPAQHRLAQLLGRHPRARPAQVVLPAVREQDAPRLHPAPPVQAAAHRHRVRRHVSEPTRLEPRQPELARPGMAASPHASRAEVL